VLKQLALLLLLMLLRLPHCQACCLNSDFL
jgi:hypothetical protein